VKASSSGERVYINPTPICHMALSCSFHWLTLLNLNVQVIIYHDIECTNNMQFLTSAIILIINSHVAIITHRGLWMGGDLCRTGTQSIGHVRSPIDD